MLRSIDRDRFEERWAVCRNMPSDTRLHPDTSSPSSSGRVNAVEELDKRFYSGVARAERPCGWAGLFGNCTKANCERCANSKTLPIAQVRAIERDCEAELAQQIRAARP